MLAPRPIPLQPGLPAHYGGPSGYKKLCQFLGVPTSKAQGDLATRILAEGQDHSQPADEQPDLNRHTNKKQRHKQAIEAFYGDPERRLSRWRRFVDDGLKERSGIPLLRAACAGSVLRSVEQTGRRPHAGRVPEHSRCRDTVRDHSAPRQCNQAPVATSGDQRLDGPLEVRAWGQCASPRRTLALC